MPYFVEAEGIAHMVSPVECDHTLCGDQFDMDQVGWSRPAKRIVTCIRCATIIRECRGVRTNPSPPGTTAAAGISSRRH